MRYCDRCHLDYKGDLDRCPLCGTELEGEAVPSDFPVAVWQRFQRTVHRALIALGAVLLGIVLLLLLRRKTVKFETFGGPGLLIALLVGAALFTLAKLLLTQGPLGTKLAKFFSLG